MLITFYLEMYSYWLFQLAFDSNKSKKGFSTLHAHSHSLRIYVIQIHKFLKQILKTSSLENSIVDSHPVIRSHLDIIISVEYTDIRWHIASYDIFQFQYILIKIK